jgi:hypothetical protein
MEALMFRKPLVITMLLLLSLVPRPTQAQKSPATALGVSLLGTAAPIVMASALNKASTSTRNNGLIGSLVLGGLFIGPSTGQFYAGSAATGFAGIGIRGVGGLIAAVGLANAAGQVFCSENCGDGDDGAGFMLAGFLTYIGGAIYSFYDASAAAGRYNARLQDPDFGIIPTLAPDPAGGYRPGALAWMRF